MSLSQGGLPPPLESRRLCLGNIQQRQGVEVLAVTAVMVRYHHNMPENQLNHHPYNRDIREVHTF